MNDRQKLIAFYVLKLAGKIILALLRLLALGVLALVEMASAWVELAMWLALFAFLLWLAGARG